MRTMNVESRSASNRRNGSHLLGWLAATAIAGSLAVGCDQASKSSGTTTGNPPPADAAVSHELSADATVQAIDSEKRLITLKTQDGRTLLVEAGPAVKNFAQIKVGDTVKARYIESLAVSLQKPGEAPVPASATVAAGSAPAGGQPAAAIGAQVSMTVTIESVDLAKNIVAFTLPSGESTATRVERQEGRDFIKGLKPGDKVEITYTRAAAISVEPTSSK